MKVEVRFFVSPKILDAIKKDVGIENKNKAMKKIIAKSAVKAKIVKPEDAV